MKRFRVKQIWNQFYPQYRQFLFWNNYLHNPYNRREIVFFYDFEKAEEYLKVQSQKKVTYIDL